MTITDEMVEVLLIAFLYYIEIVVYFQIKSTSFLIYFACIECHSLERPEHAGTAWES